MQKTKIGHLTITNESLVIKREGKSIKLHRVKALMDFNGVKKGQKGVYVEGIENVEDLGWVGEEAKLYDDAKISGLSQLRGCSELFQSAQLLGEVDVNGNCKFYGEAIINGSFMIREQVSVKDNVSIRGLGRIVGKATISDDFTCIGRLIISAYEESVDIKGNRILGSGWCLGESLEHDKLLNLAATHNDLQNQTK